MCAIVGMYDLSGSKEFDTELLDSMNASQLHRGPDDCGSYREPGLALGHRRLAIIDVEGGHQPLFNEDRSVVVVFNGEIYNFQELARELRQFGHTVRSRCDTEVIVHAWEQWGERCVDHLRGMFAFALWDRKEQLLFLARDRLGVKPLHYAVLDDGSLIFGSELKALLAHPALRRELDPLAIEDYFAYGYIPEPRTVFRQARKLAPGHTLCLRKGGALPQPKPFWDVPFAHRPAATDAAVADELQARLREAVQIRLVADVPLGAFLSGDVDSSAVVAMMAGAMSAPPVTCAIGFGAADYSEARYAAMVAERYQTCHHLLQVDQDDFALIDQLAALYDEPYADSSALPTYRLCELARRHVTVALSGDGGDESLAGYGRYRWHLHDEKLRAMLPLGLRRPLFGLLAQAYPKADWAPRPLRARATLAALARDSVDAYFHCVSMVGDEQRGHLFSPAFRASLGGYNAAEVLRRHAAACPAGDALSQIQYLDLKTHLPGDILTKVDRASMAHALEVRSPLLDHQLVEWLSGISPEQKLRAGVGKYVFKKSMAALLPGPVLQRDKMGFSVPLAGWFRGPLRQRLQQRLASGALADTGIFNMDYLALLVEQHDSGRHDHSAALWALLMFESFLRTVLQQPQLSQPLRQAA